MMGRQAVDQSQLFYLFNLEQRIPAEHLLRRLNPIVAQVLADLRTTLAPFYSEIGRLGAIVQNLKTLSNHMWRPVSGKPIAPMA